MLDRDPAAVARLAAPTRDEVGALLDPALPARLMATAPQARPTRRTVVASGPPPTTGLGSAGAAAIAARAVAPSVLRSLRSRSSDLLEGQASLPDGQVVVLELPDADTDTRAERRPRLVSRAGRVRVVLLGSSGRVLADAVLAEGDSVAAPVGTRTVVVLGGPPRDDEPAPWRRYGGWTATRPMPSASDGLLVAAGCVVDVLGAVPYRGPDPARVSWATPAELLGAERGVATTLAAPAGKSVLTAVAVAVTGAGTDDLAIGLRGARQVGELVVTTDPSGAGVAVASIDAEPGAPVRVTVASEPASPRTHLGVIAAGADLQTVKRLGVRDSAEWLAQSVATTGFATLTVAPTVAGPGTSTLAWEVP
jgi:hypothetical protein